jgi:hypothetical protein
MLAGNNLAKAEDIFARAIKHRPRIRFASARACCNSTRPENPIQGDDGNTVRHLIE